MKEMQSAQKEIDRLRYQLAEQQFALLLEYAADLQGVAVLCSCVDADNVELLRQMSDWFRERFTSGVVVLGAVINERPILIAAATPDVVAQGIRADDLVKSVSRIMGGGGGGRPTLAQAGGKDPKRLNDALSAAEKSIRETLAGVP
jgi:alanyl-tRNA synthetase